MILTPSRSRLARALFWALLLWGALLCRFPVSARADSWLDDLSYEDKAGWWFPHLSGSATVAGQALDFQRDLDLNNSTPWVGSVRWTWNDRNNLHLSLFQSKHKGSALVRGGTVFNGVPFNPGDLLDSFLTVTVLDISYDRALKVWDKGELDWYAGVKWTSADLLLIDRNLKATSGYGLFRALPQAGLYLTYDPEDGTRTYIRAGIMDWSSGGERSQVQDLTVGVRTFILPGWNLGVEYKDLHLTGRDAAGGQMDLRYAGPMLLIDYQY